MPETLPQRVPVPWLPALEALVHSDPRWAYRGSDGAPGTAFLRVWRAGVGHLAVVTELGDGRSVTNASREIRSALAGLYGEPLALAEHWPASQAPESGEHVDLVLPPGWPGGQGWAALWPVGRDNPRYEANRAWWEAYGHQIASIPV